MKKRILSGILTVMMAITMLAGCGSKATDSTNIDSGTKTTVKESDTEESSGELTHVTVATPTTLESLDQVVPFIAEKMGYFEEEGLDVTIVDGTGNDTKMIAAGQAQFGCPSPAVMMAADEAGLDLIAVCNYCVVNVFGFAVPEDSSIETWADFEGKTIALGDASWQSIAEPILEAAGIDVTKVEFQVIGDTRYQAVANGQCDILLTWLGEYGQLLGQGYKFRYFDGNEVSPQISNGIVCQRTYAENNPEIIKKMTTAYCKAIYFLYCNPEAAGDILLTRCPSIELSKDELLSALEYSNKTNLGVTEEDQKAYIESGIGLYDKQLWQNTMEAAFKAGTITKEMDVSMLYTNDYVVTDWDKAEVEEDAKEYTEFTSEAFQ